MSDRELKDRIAELTEENAHLRKHIDRRAMGTDPLTALLSDRIGELEAKLARVREAAHSLFSRLDRIDDRLVLGCLTNISQEIAVLRAALTDADDDPPPSPEDIPSLSEMRELLSARKP